MVHLNGSLKLLSLLLSPVRCILHASVITSVLLSLETNSFKVGQQELPPSGSSVDAEGGGSLSGSGGAGGSVGFVASEEEEGAGRDFVAHFLTKENLGIIFSADLRVTGFYKNRENGKVLPAEESGMVRIGDKILSVNDAPIATLKELKAAMAEAAVPVHIKFRPPPGKDGGGSGGDKRHQKTCRDFRFNITIYSSVMPMMSLTTDELIVLEAGVCVVCMGGVFLLQRVVSRVVVVVAVVVACLALWWREEARRWEAAAGGRGQRAKKRTCMHGQRRECVQADDAI